MNILLVNHERGGGGTSFSLYELIQEFIKKGHNIFVLTPYNEGPLFDKLKKLPITVLYEQYYCWMYGNSVYELPIKQKIKIISSMAFENLRVARKIARFALDNKIDIIHSNTSVINIGALISKYSGIPHVWHLREFGDLDIGVRAFGYDPFIYGFMNRYADRFICVSKAVPKHYDRLEQRKKTIVYNGVSPSNLIENQQRQYSVVNILIAGHIFEPKGQHEAVEACRMLLNQGVGNFVLNIAGPGDLYFEIPKELEDKVKLFGEVNNMPGLRKTMDIELVCSKCEAFGRVVAEAMLGGNVVIGTKSGGIPELIEDGKTGFLYSRGDIQRLSELLKYLIKNVNVRENIGNNAREYAKERFLISRCADEIEQVYREVIR